MDCKELMDGPGTIKSPMISRPCLVVLYCTSTVDPRGRKRAGVADGNVRMYEVTSRKVLSKLGCQVVPMNAVIVMLMIRFSAFVKFLGGGMRE